MIILPCCKGKLLALGLTRDLSCKEISKGTTSFNLARSTCAVAVVWPPVRPLTTAVAEALAVAVAVVPAPCIS